jgi:DNA-binding NarL/FixJ family response regulator
MSAVRVLIVDDDDLMRAGLRSILSSDEAIETVGEAANGADAVTAAKRRQPDVVLMDVRMPDVDGITATAGIVAECAAARVLVLTTFEDDDYIFGAIEAGASGFLLKRTPPEQLIAAIHTVAAGEATLSPAITRKVIASMAARPQQRPSVRRRLQELTPRERDVLELAARGRTNAEIAEKLFIEESTVKSHLKRIVGKLGFRDRVQMVIFGYEAGLIQVGEQGPPS